MESKLTLACLKCKKSAKHTVLAVNHLACKFCGAPIPVSQAIAKVIFRDAPSDLKESLQIAKDERPWLRQRRGYLSDIAATLPINEADERIVDELVKSRQAPVTKRPLPKRAAPISDESDARAPNIKPNTKPVPPHIAAKQAALAAKYAAIESGITYSKKEPEIKYHRKVFDSENVSLEQAIDNVSDEIEQSSEGIDVDSEFEALLGGRKR